MTMRKARRMFLAVIGAAVVIWGVGAAAVGVVIGRSIRHADVRLVPQLDDPLRRSGVVRDDSNAGGAILALGYAKTEAEARHWLETCARRGVPQPALRELWRQWQTEHRRNATHLHTDPEDRL